jgi:hypothetical protein
MSILGNQIYATLSERFNETHHQAQSQIVHNSIVWINNLTDEPCTQNPCEVCLELMEFGWEEMNRPQSSYNLHKDHSMYKEVA